VVVSGSFWIKDFFHGHSHCTKFTGSISELADILASVIQGSAIGPAAYLVTAADLHPMHDTNKILNFADDTYLIVPAANTNTSADELSDIESWPTDNNLKLNCAKSKEIIFQSRSNRGKTVQLPPPQQGIERVDSISALGVVINNRLTATDHISYVLTACSSVLYALRVFRSHGLPELSKPQCSRR